MKWEAHFDTGYLTLGGFGRARTGYTAVVEADTEQEARALAADALVKFNGGEGKMTHIERQYTFAITVRGKQDKRKRETFIADAVDEETALRVLRNNEKMVRFAGYKPDVLKVLKVVMM